MQRLEVLRCNTALVVALSAIHWPLNAQVDRQAINIMRRFHPLSPQCCYGQRICRIATGIHVVGNA